MSDDSRVPLNGTKPDSDDASVPTTQRRPDGQYADHWILSDEERAKGFVRPVRDSYRHVGRRPRYPLRDLTPDEQAQYAAQNYAKFEEYPESALPVTGRFWTERELQGGCGTVTSMPAKIAETYARQPSFYGSTFCCGCGQYLPVGETGEFEWLDGEKVGT